MNIVGAWKRGYTGKDVVVTILDDGIERNHPDLTQNYVSVSLCMSGCFESNSCILHTLHNELWLLFFPSSNSWK